MPRNDKEVWEYFRDGSEEDSQIDFLAFGSYSFDKFEWMEKYAEINGQGPDPAEIERWISQLPNSRLEEMSEWASNFFDNAARAYLEEEHREDVQKAVDGAVLTSIRDSNEAVGKSVEASTSELKSFVATALSFRSTFWPNVFIGLVSSLVFSVLIILAAVVFAKDPSPIALAKHLSGLTSEEAPKNGVLPERARP